MAETSANMDLQDMFPKLLRGVMEKSDEQQLNKIKFMRKNFAHNSQKYFPTRSRKSEHPTTDVEMLPNSKMNRKDAAA
jgi:hypothetical protein